MNQKFQALLLKVRKAVRRRVKESPKTATPEQARGTRSRKSQY
jgi:hypothetical protein